MPRPPEDPDEAYEPVVYGALVHPSTDDQWARLVARILSSFKPIEDVIPDPSYL